MKRVIGVFLALCLLLSLSFAVTATEKRFYVEVTHLDGAYHANVVWEGAQLADDLCAIHFELSYPEEKLVCTDWRIGPALRDFSIRQGPQYVTSNPAIFLGVEINRPVTGSGVLASFTFEAVEGAEGEAALTLNLKEILHLSDNSDCTDLFSAEGAVIDLEQAQEEKAPLCQTDASVHALLNWQPSETDDATLVKICTHCGKTVAEKKAETVTADPVTDGEAILKPNVGKLPTDAVLSVVPSEEKPTAEQLSRIEAALGGKDFTHLGALSVSLTWEGEALSLGEVGALTVAVPSAAQKEETVYVACLDTEGRLEVYHLAVTDGKVEFPVRVLGTLHFYSGEGAESVIVNPNSSGGAPGMEGDTPVTDTEVPDGPMDPVVEEPQPEADENLPSETDENLPSETDAGQGTWVIVAIVGAAAVLAALSVVFSVLRKRKASEGKEALKKEEKDA